MEPFIPCRVVELPETLLTAAAETARCENPANCPSHRTPARMGPVRPGHLAVLTTSYWGAKGVDLAVSFLDNPPPDLRDRILSHMNAWREQGKANVRFRWSQSGGQVRIARTRGSGYWSYLGTDILHVRAGEPTMNLDSFTMATSESEFIRVVRHEAGHTLGFPHEHARREIVQRLDPQKTLDYFRRTQGWSAATVRQQVLTPLEERSIMGSEKTDQDSIMCYQLPGSITRDGKPIPGGRDINAADAAFAAKLYPLPDAPPPPPPAKVRITLSGPLGPGTYEVTGAA